MLPRFLSLLVVLGLTGAVAPADELSIDGASVARPGDAIVLRLPQHVSGDAVVIVLLNETRLESDEFEVEHSFLQIKEAVKGNYTIVLKHQGKRSTKRVIVGDGEQRQPRDASAPEFVSDGVPGIPVTFVDAEAPPTVESFVDALRDADEANFAKNCQDLSKALTQAVDSDEFSAEATPSDSVSPAHSAVATAGQDFLRDKESLKPLATDFTQLLKSLGGNQYDPATATSAEVKQVVDQIQGGLKNHFESPAEETGIPFSSPFRDGSEANYDDAFKEKTAEAIKDRMFELRVNDFDPDFAETCKALADGIDEVIKKKSIKDVGELDRRVAQVVKKEVEDVSGTEVGQAKKRWKEFYEEYRLLKFFLGVPKGKRMTDPLRKRYFPEIADVDQYEPIVNSDNYFAANELEDQRAAYETFTMAMNKAIARDKVELANALQRHGYSAPSTGQAVGAGSGGYYAGTVLGRMHQRKMTRMYYHHKQRMARIRGY